MLITLLKYYFTNDGRPSIGLPSNTFLLANNVNVGRSLVENAFVNEVRAIQSKAKELSCDIILPIDVVCGKKLHDNQPGHFEIDKIPNDLMILDIGYKTTEIICNKILYLKTIVWNGPVGAFEFKPYDKGTNSIA